MHHPAKSERPVASTSIESTNYYTIIFIVVSLLVDFLLYTTSRFDDKFLLLVVGAPIFGFVFGQFFFISVLAGATGKTWLDGFLVGIALLVCGVAAFFLGAALSNSGGDIEVYAIGFTLPGGLFFVACPTIVARRMFGWRLSRGLSSADQKRSDLFSLFVNILIVAIILLGLRAAQVIWEVDATEFWGEVLTTSLVCIGLGIVVTFGGIYAAFGETQSRRFKPFLALTAIWCVIAAVAMLGLSFAFGSRPRYYELFFLEAMIVCASGVFYGALRTLHYAGFRIRALPQRRHVNPIDRETENVAVPGDRPRIWISRLKVGGIAAFVLLASVLVASMQAKRNQFDAKYRAVKKKVDELGGDIGEFDRTIHRLRLDRATDESLAEVISEVGRLSHHRVDLDLSNSSVTDASLRYIGSLNLESLDLSNTSVQGAEFRHLSKLKLNSLSLRGLDLTLADWDSIATENLTSFWIGDSQVDGPAIGRFFSRCQFRVCSLSGANVPISELLKLNGGIATLNLSDVPITDEILKRLLAKLIPSSPSLRRLDLSRTEITDRTLQYLGGHNVVHELALNGTSISDAGIALLEKYSLTKLEVASTDVTGAGFANWRSELRHLDLSDTQISDGSVNYLKSFSFLRSIKVQKTKLTDAALPALLGSRLQSLDARGSAITANGIVRHAIPAVKFTVTPMTFTPRQSQQLLDRGIKFTYEKLR